MKSIQMHKKYVPVSPGSQAENVDLSQSVKIVAALVVCGTLLEPMAARAQSTSPLEILQQAPKVRIEDPDPTPPPAMTPSFVPPRSAAPPVEPAPPAFTPYAGSSSSGRQPAPASSYYGQPAPPPAPRYIPTPTPRPILGPEDVEKNRGKEKKGGIVRGLFRAIPFVGGKDETPVPPPKNQNPDGRAGYAPGAAPAGEIYRGYDVPPSTGSDEPILLPPGSTPLAPKPELDLDRTEVPERLSSPPILTPEPRLTAPGLLEDADSSPVDLDSAAPGAGAGVRPSKPPVTPSGPLLTVKRETDDTTSATAAEESTSADGNPVKPAVPAGSAASPAAEAKRPAVAPAEDTPRPLERATTGVLIQESRPAEPARRDNLGPEPDASAAVLKPYDPTAEAATPTPAAETVLDVDDRITSLSIEQSDLGMPNPAYEQNTTVLGEFQDGVRRARTEDYAGAARIFREYALNHPSSGLAPRAYFLSIIFESSRSQARENLESLKRLFPESRYVKEAQQRRRDELKGGGGVAIAPSEDSGEESTATSGAATPVVSAETVPQQIARLERELTAAVGNADTEPDLRKRLGVLYLDQEKYDRAYEILRPAADMAQGTPLEGEIMLALGRTLMARGEAVQAISLYEAVEAKHPDVIEGNAASAWSVALAYEGAGRYAKSRVLYNTIRQKWPASPEAGWAATRLQELASLRQ